MCGFPGPSANHFSPSVQFNVLPIAFLRCIITNISPACLSKNSYNESKCQSQIDALYECCNLFYVSRGEDAKCISCPKSDLLNLKMKQRAREKKSRQGDSWKSWRYERCPILCVYHESNQLGEEDGSQPHMYTVETVYRTGKNIVAYFYFISKIPSIFCAATSFQIRSNFISRSQGVPGEYRMGWRPCVSTSKSGTVNLWPSRFNVHRRLKQNLIREQWSREGNFPLGDHERAERSCGPE